VEQDVLAFFAQHDIVDRVADGPKAVNIMTRSNGRPSGQAVVQMREPADAEIAMQVLHGQWMGQRYIEVFLLNADEEVGKPLGEKKNIEEMAAVSAATAGAVSTTSSAPSQLPQATAPAPSLNGPPPDLSNLFPGMPGLPPAPNIPPWQVGLWSSMATNLGPSLGAADFASSEPSSWEALFEFLGPEGTAAQLAAAGQLPLDYGLPMGYPGFPPVPGSFPQGTSEGTRAPSGLPTPSGTAAATV
jgi:hypothetical protein